MCPMRIGRKKIEDCRPRETMRRAGVHSTMSTPPFEVDRLPELFWTRVNAGTSPRTVLNISPALICSGLGEGPH